MMAPCRSGDDLHDMGEDLMTRSQVATLFRVTSAAVASWARRGRLPEVRNEAGRGTGARTSRRCSAAA